MTTRYLLFDIGNTRVKWGVLDDGSLRRTGAVRHADLKTAGFDPLTRRLPRKVDGVLASNVAGAGFAKRIARAVGIHCDTDVRFVTSRKDGYGITSAYRRPRTLGVDRWIAMLAARAEFRTALCIVDAGTAITIDALDRSGRHLGGQIIPGLGLMGSALRSDTSDIGAAKRGTRDPEAGAPLFGDSTDKAIAYGALNAVCGAIERAARQLKSLGQRPKTVLTGGDASRILRQLDGAPSHRPTHQPIHRPNLVLQGLAIMTQSDE